MTKAEEIKSIHKYYNSLPEDSYLKDILKGVPEDCEQQISSDFAMGYMETIDNLTSKNQVLLGEFENFKSVHRADNEAKQQMVNEKYELKKFYDDIIDDLKKQLKDVGAEYAEALKENSLLEKDMEEADLTIIRLKAKVYDMMEIE